MKRSIRRRINTDDVDVLTCTVAVAGRSRANGLC